MTQKEIRNLKAHLSITTADLHAAKVLVRNPHMFDLDRLRCSVIHIIESGGAIMKLLDDDQPVHPDTFEDERPIMLDLDDSESLVTGRITVDPATVPTNGAGKEVEEHL